MNADSDYARVVEILSHQTLAPYVSYAHENRVGGMVHDTERARVVVRLSDGKIVAGGQPVDVDSSSSYDRHESNPVTKPAFDAACYRATDERLSTYDGAPALEISLVSICENDKNNTFATLYAEPHSLRPLDVQGSASIHEHLGHMQVSLDQTFAVFDGRSMPAALRVDVRGSGLMFWVQVHVNETYSDYQFLNSYSGRAVGTNSMVRAVRAAVASSK
jgi:hypothetical protein